MVTAARIPKPPAALVAAVSRAPDTQPMPVCTTGSSHPTRSQNRVRSRSDTPSDYGLARQGGERLRSCRAVDLPRTADVVVVGAGIAGASAGVGDGRAGRRRRRARGRGDRRAPRHRPLGRAAHRDLRLGAGVGLVRASRPSSSTARRLRRPSAHRRRAACSGSPGRSRPSACAPTPPAWAAPHEVLDAAGARADRAPAPRRGVRRRRARTRRRRPRRRRPPPGLPARRCGAAGGTVALGTPVTAIARQGGGWRVVTTPAGDDRHAASWSTPPARGATSSPPWPASSRSGSGRCGARRSSSTRPTSTTRAWPLVVDVGEPFYVKPDAGRLLGSPADDDPERAVRRPARGARRRPRHRPHRGGARPRGARRRARRGPACAPSARRRPDRRRRPRRTPASCGSSARAATASRPPRRWPGPRRPPSSATPGRRPLTAAGVDAGDPRRPPGSADGRLRP